MSTLVGPATPLPNRPVIGVIGAGAVGGYYGARLAQHGHDVHFLLRSEFDTVRRTGWTIHSCDGDFTLPPGSAHVYNDVAQIPKADLVIVALKTTSQDLYEPLIAPLIRESTALFSIQNGLGTDERLAELFGASRVLGGLAFVCINRGEAGVIHHLDHGMIRLGEFSAPPGARAHQLVQMLRDSLINCEVLADLRAGRWTKLIWNIPFNGLGAVMDLSTDKLIGTAPGREMIGKLMTEVMLAAERAAGVKFDVTPQQMIERQIKATASMGAYRTSMQIDRQQGRALEVEAILGEPLRRARAAGAQTPYLQHLYELACAVDPAAARDRETGASNAPASP